MNQVWHREAVGGLWKEMGRLQFDFLANQGRSLTTSCSTSVAACMREECTSFPT